MHLINAHFTCLSMILFTKTDLCTCVISALSQANKAQRFKKNNLTGLHSTQNITRAPLHICVKWRFLRFYVKLIPYSEQMALHEETHFRSLNSGSSPTKWPLRPAVPLRVTLVYKFLWVCHPAPLLSRRKGVCLRTRGEAARDSPQIPLFMPQMFHKTERGLLY